MGGSGGPAELTLGLGAAAALTVFAGLFGLLSARAARRDLALAKAIAHATRAGRSGSRKDTSPPPRRWQRRASQRWIVTARWVFSSGGRNTSNSIPIRSWRICCHRARRYTATWPNVVTSSRSARTAVERMIPARGRSARILLRSDDSAVHVRHQPRSDGVRDRPERGNHRVSPAGKGGIAKADEETGRARTGSLQVAHALAAAMRNELTNSPGLDPALWAPFTVYLGGRVTIDAAAQHGRGSIFWVILF